MKPQRLNGSLHNRRMACAMPKRVGAFYLEEAYLAPLD
jgi:hypothetical protein